MKIGFIGAGNMASAIVEGIVQKGFSKPEDIYMISQPKRYRLLRIKWAPMP